MMPAVDRGSAVVPPSAPPYPSDPAFPIPVLRLAGPLDRSTGAALCATLRRTLADEPAGIVLDASGLTTVEDSALTTLRTFAGIAGHWPGCPVVLCAPSTQLVAALERLGIAPALPVQPSTARAVAAVRGAPSTGRYGLRLAGVPSSAGRARALVAEACAAWGVDDLVTEAQVVVSELVGNAVRYAGGEVLLVVRRTARLLHLAAYDRNPVPPVRGQPDPVAESGRGLVLVDAIAAAWGTLPAGGGKLVWAALRLLD